MGTCSAPVRGGKGHNDKQTRRLRQAKDSKRTVEGKKVEEMDASSKVLREHLAAVEESNGKRLDRILELEGLEKDRDFNKKKIEEYKDRAKDLELKVMSLTSENEVKDRDFEAKCEELKDSQEKARYFEHEFGDSKRELQQKLEHDSETEAPLSQPDFVSPDLAENWFVWNAKMKP